MTNKENNQSQGNYGFDPFKVFQNSKIPGIDIDAMVNICRKNIETLESFQSTANEAIKSLTQLQSQFMRTTMEDSANYMRQMMASGTNMQEKADLQSCAIKKGLEKSSQLAGEVSSILNKSSEKIVKATGNCATDIIDSCTKASKSQK